jgi:ATP-dependent RNA helicase SUPV3L1/SUV3
MDALVSPLKNHLRVTRSPLGNGMWLVAGTETSLVSGDFKVRGYIEESLLATQAHWKKLSVEARDQLEADRLATCSEALEAALMAAVVEISEFVTTCAAEGLQPDLRRLRDEWSSGELNLVTVEAALDQTLTDLRADRHHRDLADQIARNVKLSDYPDTFPAAFRKRKLIAVLGPTNSGKTYDAFKRLATARAGAYLGPLRLLALEAFTRLNDEFGVVSSLITGEERRIVPGSRVTASTIEMLDTNRHLEVAVIDEIQMLTDPDRGWAWTQAVVGANADEVWLLGALSAEPAIRALAARLNLPLEIRKKERKHPLVVAEQSLAPHPNNALRMAKPGDAFIVFSRRDALNLRDDLLALKMSVACIYGALSPEVRESEARRFASGDADILVATDAIGMGLNLPIQRVVFTSVTKYDGTERGVLPVPLLQQIGGRAGRYGHTGEEGVVVGLTPAEHSVVTKLMGVKQENLPTTGFLVTPGSAYLEQLAAMSGDNRLEALLSLFMLHCDRGDKFFVPHVPEEQLSRSAQLDRLVNLPLLLKHTFSMAPMPSNHEDIDQVWRTWARMANLGKPIRLNFLLGEPGDASLKEAETTVRLLAAYRWFGYRLPEIFVDYDDAEAVLEPWTSVVDEHLRSRRKQGVGGGRKGMPSWYWETKRTDPRLVDVEHQPASMTRRRGR